MAGSPVFLCTLAPLNQFLFERFGWRGSFFILGGMLLNCCVAGALMRPLNNGRAVRKNFYACFIINPNIVYATNNRSSMA